jgi:hypothetical protein
MSANDADRRRLRLLWIGAATYFLILVNGLRFFAEVPYQFVLLGMIVNAIMLTALVVTIRKVYKRIQSGDAQIQVPAPTPSATYSAKPQNVRALWLAAGFYFVLMVIAFQYATRVPYQVLVLGAVLNMAIVLTFVVKLRKAYMNRGKQS